MADADQMFALDQVTAKGAHFDDQKVMPGFDGATAARAAYLENDTKGWKGFGEITKTSVGDLKKWFETGDIKQVFAKRCAVEVLTAGAHHDHRAVVITRGDAGAVIVHAGPQHRQE